MTQMGLHHWLAAAFQRQPGWVVTDEQKVSSYQQSMTHVRLEWPVTGATDEIFVRVYRGYMSWWTLEAWDLPEREQTALRVAARAGVPVPELLCLLRSADEAVAMLRRAPGDTSWAAAPSLEIANALAETLARLHHAPILTEDREHLPDVSVPALLSRLARWAEEAEVPALRQSVAVMADQLAAVPEWPVGLIHGDCHEGNILAEGARVTALIDWEEAGLGDPRLDVMLLSRCLRRLAPETADGFERAYQERLGFPLGPPTVWRDLTHLRSQIMSTWVQHQLAQGRSLPSDNPEVWID